MSRLKELPLNLGFAVAPAVVQVVRALIRSLIACNQMRRRRELVARRSRSVAYESG